MTSLPGKNEGFRILDEFVCQAIPDASAVAGEATRPAAGVGENEGMHIMAEAASHVPGDLGPDMGSAAQARTEREGTALSKRKSMKLSDLRSLSALQLRLLFFLTDLSVEDLLLIREVLEERRAAADAEPTDEEMQSIIESIISSQ